MYYMKILNLSLDRSVALVNSRAAARMVDYGQLVDKYTIIVPAEDYKTIKLSDKTEVYCITGGNKIVKLLNYYKLAKKILGKERYNVITVQDQYYLALVGLWLAKKFNIGLELQVHGFEKYFGLRKIIAKYVLPRADAIRTVSQKLKKRLIDEYGIREERITAVPIYVKTVVKSKKLKVKSKNDKFVFLTISRLVPVKNIRLQIKAIAEIVKQYQKVELWIVGEGLEKNNLELLIKQVNLFNKVKLLGWQNEIAKFYQDADAFLLTSDSEGWPQVIIEAASFGLPIIMTDTGSAGEFIINEENGIVIPINDLPALVAAMQCLITDSQLRQQIGASALKSAMKLPAKDQILTLYQESWNKAIDLAKTK